MRLKSIHVVLVFFACITSAFAQIRDPFDVLNLTAGESVTLPISDLYYLTRYKPTFSPPKGIRVTVDNRQRVTFSATEEAEGFRTISFREGSYRYDLPVRVTIKPQRTFYFKPVNKPQKITLFGSFNGWNRDTLPLTDPEGDGTFSCTVSLDPGSYEYKFFVDGEEVLDPENPEKAPNGFGGFNSVLRVQPRHNTKTFLHFGTWRKTATGSQFSFLYERAGDPIPLQKQHVVALLDNRQLSATQISINDHTVILQIPNDDIETNQLLRIAITQDGLSTPVKEVFLHFGKPRNNESPFIWQDATLYSLMIDRFKDGDPGNNRPVIGDSLHPEVNYMGGDLKGVLQKLESGYFDQLGVNVLWLSPVVDNAEGTWGKSAISGSKFTAYHGYWPTNLEKVEDRFGTLSLLRTVVQKAHAKGMKVILDFVAHHVHQNHPWVKQNPTWFGHLYLPDGRKNIELWDEQRLTTWFDTFLPTFNYLNSPEAIEAVAENAMFWIRESGVDGFRQDAVKHVPNEFWRALTRKIRAYEIVSGKRLFQIGETFGSYDLIKSYVNRGQLDAQFNFNLFYRARSIFLTPSAEFSLLAAELEATQAMYGSNHLMGNLMDSHDQVRYMAYADGDLKLDADDAGRRAWFDQPQADHAESFRKVALYMAYMMAIPGLPTIYYGDEIGISGSSDPDNRRMMRFAPQLNASEAQLLKEIQQISNLRRQLPALRYGDFLPIKAEQGLFAFLRSDYNQRVLVVLNKQDHAQEVRLSLPSVHRLIRAQELLTGTIINLQNQEMLTTLPAHGAAFFVLE
ncbi:MAG: alpha-glucosidase C-terminal domain-containing protein [Bacteroidetes Order II. Incertae sedis bacterium]|nr:alpha-glucosidase C-terminal domain-containing protein [Bacteroidetes Order II. bacterium]